MGIEPTQPAWKAGILAIELHPQTCSYINKKRKQCQLFFPSKALNATFSCFDCIKPFIYFTLCPFSPRTRARCRAEQAVRRKHSQSSAYFPAGNSGTARVAQPLPYRLKCSALSRLKHRQSHCRCGGYAARWKRLFRAWTTCFYAAVHKHIRARNPVAAIEMRNGGFLDLIKINHRFFLLSVFLFVLQNFMHALPICIRSAAYR